MHMIDRIICYGWVLGIGLALTAATALADQMTRPANGVTRIVFNTPGELVVRAGAEEKLLVEAEAKVLAQLDINAQGDTLTLASKGSFKTDKGLKYTLTIKSFRGLKTGASGNSSIEGFSGSDVDIELGGSGNVGLKNMKAGRLGIMIKSSGNVEAAGSGKTVVARIDGSGNIDTTNFQAQVVEARIDGSGTIRVHADESLNAAIGGAGNIEYKGKAKVTQSITGAGNVGRI
jgi:Putative auto-transporter adhesin, head GIN domain